MNNTGFIAKFGIFALLLLCLFSSCVVDRVDWICVRLVANASKGIENNFISSENLFPLENYGLFYHATPTLKEEAYGETEKNTYLRLAEEETILLSQGEWVIHVIFLPKTDVQDSTLLYENGTISGTSGKVYSDYLLGSSKPVYVNLFSDIIYVYLEENHLSSKGYMTIDSYTFSAAPSETTLIYQIFELTHPETVTTVTLDSSNSVITQNGNKTAFRLKDKVALHPGTYGMKVEASKDSKTIFTDFIAFTIHGGIDTIIKGVCESFDTIIIEPVPIIPKDPAKPTESGNIISYDSSTMSPSETTTNDIGNMDPGYVYQVTNPQNHFPHHDNDKDQDRIVLGEDPKTPNPGNYGLDLNGKDMLMLKQQGTSDLSSEKMTLVTIGENQSLTLFNSGTSSASILGNMWGQSVSRYDCIVGVNGGTLFCAPDGYSKGTFKLQGPYQNNYAYTQENGVYRDHVKQGAVNISGNGGSVNLNSSNIVVEGVKGITSHNTSDGYTSLNQKAQINIQLTNGVQFNLQADSSDDTNARSTNHAAIQAITKGVDLGAPVYLTGKRPDGSKTNANISITANTGANLTSGAWGLDNNALNSVGIYVGDTKGNVAINVNEATIQTSAYGWMQNGCNAAGILLENVEGTIHVDLQKCNFTTLNNNGFTYNVYLKGCTGTIRLKVDEAYLRSAIHCIVLENCSEDIILEVTNAASKADPLTGNQGDILISGCSGTITLKDSYSTLTATNGTYSINAGSMARQ